MTESFIDWKKDLPADVGKLEAAIASYNQTLKINPDDDVAWYDRGIALGELGRYDEALASFDQALKLKLDDHKVWNNRGIALGELGRYDEALASFDQALKLKPDDHEAWSNRGIVLHILGCDEQAIASYNQALKFKPDYDYAWYNKACYYVLQGDVIRSIENLQKAIELNPELREKAKIDLDFYQISHNKEFQLLIEESHYYLDWQDLEEIDEQEWLHAAANNPVFDFLNDPEEDIYTLADGKPFND